MKVEYQDQEHEIDLQDVGCILPDDPDSELERTLALYATWSEIESFWRAKYESSRRELGIVESVHTLRNKSTSKNSYDAWHRTRASDAYIGASEQLREVEEQYRSAQAVLRVLEQKLSVVRSIVHLRTTEFRHS